MKRMSIHAVALAAALSLTACGGDTTANREMTGGDPAQPGPAPMTQTSAPVDRAFIQNAAGKNLAEIELSTLASQRAQNPQVKEFARTMIDEHTKALDELRQIARRENLQIDEQVPEDQHELREKLQGLKGAAFDREYMNAMVEGHQEMHDMLEDKAGDQIAMGQDRADRPAAEGRSPGAVGTVGQPAGAQAELNQWASRTLPAVERHRQRAEEIRDQLENRGRTGSR